MNEQPVPSKADILDLLRTSGEDAARRLRAIPAERFEQGRYENGWNGRQILAHVAAIEWTYPRLLDIPKQPQTETAGSGSPPTASINGGMDAYNHRQVERRAGASIEDLITEFETNRKATIAAFEAAPDEVFARPIRSAGGSTGRLGEVIREVAVQHMLGHVGDIEGK